MIFQGEGGGRVLPPVSDLVYDLIRTVKLIKPSNYCTNLKYLENYIATKLWLKTEFTKLELQRFISHISSTCFPHS